MRRKYRAALVAMVLFAASCTACDYHELDDLVLITGVGIDRIDGGRIMMSAEIITMSKGGSQGEYTPNILKADGYTVMDAMSNMVSTTSGEMQYGHCQAIIIDETIAKEGMMPLIYELYTGMQFDTQTPVFVAYGSRAADLLATEPLTMPSQSLEISSTVDHARYLEKTSELTLHQLFSDLNDKQVSTVIPTLYHTAHDGEQTVALQGFAVMNGDRMAGFLDGEEAQAYLYAADRVQNGSLLVKRPDGSSFSGQVKASKTQIRPVFDDGALSVEIEVDTTISYINFYLEGASVKALEQDAAEYLQRQITAMLNKTRQEYGCDVLNLQRTVMKWYNREWRRMDNSADTYLHSPFEIRATVTILDKERVGGGGR